VARTIPQRELRNQNAQIVDAVAAGETFIITRNGEPVAELRPFPKARARFVSRREIASVTGSGPRLDAAAFRRDLDKVVDQSLTR
jgi:prevent-host-death family protein